MGGLSLRSLPLLLWLLSHGGRRLLLLLLLSLSPMASFSLCALDEHGLSFELSSFSSLEEAEEALSSLLDSLEEAPPRLASSLRSLAADLEEQVSSARFALELEEASS